MARWPNKIQVRAKMDRMGNILVWPVGAAYAKAFVRVCNDNGGSCERKAFFQEGMGAQEFMENDVPRKYWRDLENGYEVTWMADPWVVGHWYGWDAHTAVY